MKSFIFRLKKKIVYKPGKFPANIIVPRVKYPKKYILVQLESSVLLFSVRTKVDIGLYKFLLSSTITDIFSESFPIGNSSKFSRLIGTDS